MFARWVLAAAFSALVAVGCAPSQPRDKVVHVEADDPEMEQAKAAARSRLPEFWAVVDDPKNGETDFALKVEVTDASGTEFFWCNNLIRRDGKLFGTINNDPNTVQSVKFGQEIEIADDKIADWTYIKDDKIYGNLTMRPLLKTLPKEQADELRAQLAEP